MKDEVRETIYEAFKTLPLLSGRHLLPMFKEHGSPEKRVSAVLKELEEEKLVENKRLGDMSRVWRLTLKGKYTLGIQRRSISLSSSKIQHYLAIADLYTKLNDTGKLKYFQVELREPFTHAARNGIYSPDALFIYDKSIYLSEVQLTRLSRSQWAQKWNVANTYFNEGYYRQASWQRWRKTDYIKPIFVVISPQDPDIVREGFAVDGRILKISTESSTVFD